MADSDDEIQSLIKDISIFAKDLRCSLNVAKCIKNKVAEFESNLGPPLCLKEPLYDASFKHAGDSIHDLICKIKAALEEGDLTHAVALQTIIIAKLFVSTGVGKESIVAISDLADIYYKNKLFDQASATSCSILKHISVIEKDCELSEIKIKSYYMIAKDKIIQKRYEKANENLRMGNVLTKSRHVVSDGLKGMYYRIKAELNDAQDLYLSAIESYQALLDNKLYENVKDHVDILISLHRLYRSSGNVEHSMIVLEKADLVNNSANPRNMLMFLRLQLLLINNLESDQINRALDIAERTINEIKNMSLNQEEKKKELLIRNRYIQLLMKGAQYEKALTEQKVLTHMVLDANDEESIKITLNQIQHAQILSALGKQNGSISLFRKTLHNKRFRDHLRHPVFEKKLKSLLEAFDKQSQAKLIANCRELEKHIECA